MAYKKNLFFGFGISLFILLITSAASYISIQNLLVSAQLVNHAHETIIETEKIISGLRDAESSQRGYIITGDMAFMEYYDEAKRQSFNSLNLVKELTKDEAIQQDAVSELEHYVNIRLAALQRLIEIKNEAGVVAPRLLHEGKTHMDTIRSTIDTIRVREAESLAARTGDLNRFATFTPLLIVFAAVIAFIITTLFFVRIKNDLRHRLRLQQELEDKDREVSERIEIIRTLAGKISTGNYAIRISDQQSDALGSVAGALNKMAASLEHSFSALSDNEWLQSGAAGLNDAIIGEKSMTLLTRHVMDFICRYINAQAGALFILEQDRLALAAGYAYAADASKSFALGEGLLGQAVAAREVLQINDMPAENIVIKFATGEAYPKHVVVVPIFDGMAVKGGIEVATLTSFSAREIEFLTSCAQNIGIAISTAQNRRKLQELLEETQAQAEELQAQHRELENMNSELESQSDRLQASEEELRAQQEELRLSNQHLEERTLLLEERNKLISAHSRELQIKAEELAQSARYKSEFLANMSHELRTPLNSILLLSRLMAENNDHNLTPDQVEYARVIEVSGKGLLTLIDEILDLSKIEAGKMELEFTPVAVTELADEMQSLFAPVAKEKALAFNITIAADAPVMVETDRMRLGQIMRNLLGNAFKFTAQGHVGLQVVRHPDKDQWLCIAIEDTGIGIPDDKQQLIFEAFQQADGSTQRKYGGTGLGLSICKELIRLLGGEIRVHSVVAQGSTFTICLPVHRSNALTSFSEQSIASSQGALPSAADPYLSTEIPDDVADDRDHISVGDKVILIIEDDVHFARALLDYTRSCGYKGIVSVRGDEGIQLATRYLPVGILLDIQLPVKSGWDVMAELKSSVATRHIPVHIMSSHEVKRESLQQGAVDFIDKPIALEQMQEIFKKIEYVITHHPKKVLIVEENAYHAEALAYFLRTFDLRMDVQNNVDAAISALQKDDIDCVVLDMGLPHETSYGTLERINNTPGLEGLPVIVFTGSSLSRQEEVRIKKYADSIVVKTAHSYQRVLDEVSLFLHLMERKEGDISKNRYSRFGAMDEVLNGKTVLIADDDARNIFSLSKALDKFNINIITSVDGKDALQQLEANPHIDIVLMDMMMPEMNGYQSTAAIRQDPRFKNLPIIAVTAKAMVGDREKCISAGASDYITKPVDIDQLLSLLRVWLYERG